MGRDSSSSQQTTRKTTPLGMGSWALYDWASNAYPTLILTFIFAAYFTQSVAEDETTGTAVWGITLGVAGFFVALIAPMLGATMDHIGRRKPWIAVFTSICVLGVALLWFVEPHPGFIWLALLLVVISELGMEYSAILYNAMLPTLVPEERVGRWSGWGWTMGYAGGLMCLVTALVLFVQEGALIPLDREEAHHVRATFPLAAAWFAVFAIPLLVFTPDQPRSDKPVRRAVRDGWRQLRDSVRQVRRYKNILRFLIARIIFVDGMATMFMFGGVYAAGTFGMDASQILLFGIGLNVSSGLGALIFSWVDDRIGSKRTIIIGLVGLILPGIAILVVDTVTLLWVCGLILGFFVGPAQASSRSLMARLAPPELRGQMFGLFAFSGKVAFFCPLLVAAVTYLFDSQRAGMSVVIVFWMTGLAIMMFVQEKRG